MRLLSHLVADVTASGFLDNPLHLVVGNSARYSLEMAWNPMVAELFTPRSTYI